MKEVISNRKAKIFNEQLRPSKSLHNKFVSKELKSIPKQQKIQSSQQIMVCIIFKKKKIQFFVPNELPFKELNVRLYHEFNNFLLSNLMSPDHILKTMSSVLGFESTDGDINFDYRLSLEKGIITKSKFFYPFFAKSKSQGNKINYKIYNCLAIGGFSKVYLSRSYEDGKFYAIKFIKRNESNVSNDQQTEESLRNEVKICKEINHPFLVKLYHAFSTKKFYCMVFEYCPGGELFYLLKKVRIMNEKTAKFYFIQILYGIQHLHSKSIIYRDLKPENILIDCDGNCKIVDFGLSKKMDSRGKTFSYCGSAEYMAPEMILRSGHSFGIDYYSLGALLYELVTGLPPFYTKNHEQLQQSIIYKDLFFPEHILLSQEIKDFLQKLLKKQEKYRLGSYIGVKQILFHPWIGKLKSSQILNKQMEIPYPTILQNYNFDKTELGEDECQFTEMIEEELSLDKKGKLSDYEELSKISNVTKLNQKLIDSILAQNVQKFKENIPKEKSLKKMDRYSLSKLRERFRKKPDEDCSRSLLQDNTNILQSSWRNRVSDSNKLLKRNNNTLMTDIQRKQRDIRKLYPYFQTNKITSKGKKISDILQRKATSTQKNNHKYLKKQFRIINNDEN